MLDLSSVILIYYFCFRVTKMEKLETFVKDHSSVSVGAIGRFFQRHPVVLTLGFLLGATACGEPLQPYQLPNGYTTSASCLGYDADDRPDCESIGFCSDDNDLIRKSYVQGKIQAISFAKIPIEEMLFLDMLTMASFTRVDFTLRTTGGKDISTYFVTRDPRMYKENFKVGGEIEMPTVQHYPHTFQGCGLLESKYSLVTAPYRLENEERVHKK